MKILLSCARPNNDIASAVLVGNILGKHHLTTNKVDGPEAAEVSFYFRGVIHRVYKLTFVFHRILKFALCPAQRKIDRFLGRPSGVRS